MPVIGRFALAGGLPYAADEPRTVRSMALLFQLQSGEEWRTGMNDIPVFHTLVVRDRLLARMAPWRERSSEDDLTSAR